MEPTKISGSQNSQSTQATRAKSPAQQQGVSDAGNEAAASGFLALLAAMGDAAGDGVVLTGSEAVTGPADLMADVPAGGADPSAVAAWHGLFGAVTNDGAQGAAVGDAASAGTFGAAGGSMGSMLGGLTVDGRTQGLVAETMKLDTSVDLKDGQPLGATTGFSRAFSRFQSGQAQRPGTGGALDTSAVQVVSGESLQHRIGGHATTAALVQSMNERVSSGAQHMNAAVERTGSALGVPVGAELTGAVVAGALASLASTHGADSSGGSRAGEGHPGANAGSDAGSAPAAPETGGVDNAQTFSDANPMGAEEQVADQVAYWVNQKTQSAEMTLNRDGQPVEVSVSLSGNEAHVSFRSDQAETRALLDQSMAQLSDLLRSEGLVLSGMSVGTSAQGGSGANGERGQTGGREGARHAQVVSKVPAGSSSLVRGAVASDRAVDVFV